MSSYLTIKYIDGVGSLRPLLKRIFAALTGLAVICLAYLLFWPVPIEPQAWNPPENKGYVGVFAPNNRLSNLERVSLQGDYGAEDAAFGPDGLLYMSTHGGKILRYEPETGEMSTFTQTGGRPLGIEFGPNGNLYVADAYRGLLEISRDGGVSVLTDSTDDGSPILFADDLDVASDGTIYFSDASTRFGAKEWGGPLPASLMETIEAGRSGRVLVYSPETQSTTIIMEDLAFANGVALTEDEKSLLVVETGGYAIKKLALGSDAPAETLIDNLPGYPDNINRNADGSFWVGVAYPRTEEADALADKPFLRKIIVRLPFQPDLPGYGLVFKMDEHGAIQSVLQDPTSGYAAITGLIEGPNGEAYLTSVSEIDLGLLVQK
jgi:sugar lactone lactonase YvrE